MFVFNPFNSIQKTSSQIRNRVGSSHVSCDWSWMFLDNMPTTLDTSLNWNSKHNSNTATIYVDLRHCRFFFRVLARALRSHLDYHSTTNRASNDQFKSQEKCGNELWKFCQLIDRSRGLRNVFLVRHSSRSQTWSQRLKHTNREMFTRSNNGR